jgi:hypothetical protein
VSLGRYDASVQRAFALVVLLLVAGPAHATRCAPTIPSAPHLAEIDAEVRLDWIRGRLRDHRRKLEIWGGLWIGIYGAITVYNVQGLARSDNTTDYIDWSLGVFSTVVGVIATAAQLPGALPQSPALERHVAASRDACALVAEAEWRLAKLAHSDQFNTGPLTHGGNFVFNAALVTALLIVGHYQEAAIHGLAGIAVGEIQTITRPTTALKALRRYRLGLLEGQPLPPPFSWAIAPNAAPGRYTLDFALSW